MMKKPILALIGFLLAYQSLSQILIVDNNDIPLTGPNVYTTFALALGDAGTGDTIMLMPSSTSYGNITINIPVHVIGAGFRSQVLNGGVSQVGQIEIDGTASGGSISGVYQTTATIYFDVTSSNLDGFIIRNSRIRRLDFPTGANVFDNVTVSNNVIGNNINTTNIAAVTMQSLSGTNILTNNIIYGNTTGYGSVQASFIDMTRNVFVGIGADANYLAFREVNDCNVNNNIFYGRSAESAAPVSFHGNTFSDNLTFNTNDDSFANTIPGASTPPNTGPGPNFQQAIDPEFVDLPLGSAWDDSYDVNIQSGSPAETFSIGLDYTLFIPRGLALPYFEELFGTHDTQFSTSHEIDVRIQSYNLANIVAAEYFYDYNDMGVGANTPISVSGSVPVVDRITLADAAGLTHGVHSVHIRIRDINGWGFPEKYALFVGPDNLFVVNDITAAEYYIDIDPGYGGGTPATVTSNDTVDLAEAIDTAPLSEGFHLLYLRTQNQFGDWSLPEKRLFYVDPSGASSTKVVDNAEYFFDVDPGYGAATALTVAAPANIVDLAQGLPTGGLSIGFHTLYVRVQAEGTWGQPESRLVYVDPSSEGALVLVDDLEYFFDVDPGYGNGDTLTVSSAQNVVDVVEAIPTGALTPGFHILYLRGKTAEDTWGLSEQRLVYVDASDVGANTNVEAVEYFFDTDPGYGSGIEINPTADSVVEIMTALAASGLPAGQHSVTIRPRDSDGVWGMGETMIFNNPGPGRELDSLALKVFYDQTNGPSWNTSTGWLSGTIDTWAGVTVIGDRVDSLILPANNLVGTIPLEVSYMENLKKIDVHSNSLSGDVPVEFTDLTSLEIGYIFDNDLENLPDLSSLTGLTEFAVDSNRFDFGDLEPNNTLTGFTYENQKLPNDPGLDSIIGVGDNAIVAIETFGASNTYQWYQDGAIRPDQTSKDLNIASFTPSDTGTYHLEINNSLITDLTITTDNYRLRLSDFEEDSVAMVSLYNALDGPNWDDNTNWLTGDLSTWNGVTVGNNRVTDLNLSANSLSGIVPADLSYADSLVTVDLHANGITDTLPASLDQLQHLESLNVSFNDLRSIPDLNAITGLNTLDVEGNRIQFGDLEINLGVPTLIYNPQDSISDPIDTLIDVGSVVTISLPINGANNTYQWLKDGVNFSTTQDLQFSDLQQTDEARYRLEISNSLITDMILYSATIDLKISSRERDSIALVTLYDSTGGSGWTDNTSWLTGNIDSWFGVTVESNRVTEVALPSNNLIGEIPDALLDITGLISLDVSGNDITYVPAVINLLNMDNLNVANCQLGFSEVNRNIGVNNYTYSPQQLAGVATTELIPVNTDFELSTSISGSNNEYQWKYEGDPISGATADTYTIPQIDFDNMGKYTVDVTNPAVVGLTISSDTTTAWAVTDVFGQVFNINGTDPLTIGDIILYQTTDSGPWDSTTTVSIGGNGAYEFEDVILGDYVLLARPDLDTDPTLLQTYSGNSILWEEADTIILRDVIDAYDITMQQEPTAAPTGDAQIAGVIESNLEDNSQGRLEAGRRVRRAQVMLRRRPPDSRPENDGFEFIAYIESNDLGEFLLTELPPGTYRINIEFPGIPMDETSTIEFELGTDFDNEELSLLAVIEEAGISITIEDVTGVPRPFLKDINVYPNPGTDVVQLAYHVNRDISQLKMKIVDASGRTLNLQGINHFPGNHQIAVDISDLAEGVYQLILTDGTGRFSSYYRIRKE